ncbi:N-acetylgalactosaminyltransferase 6-like [Contarinia nasturtii]|uniref:N-acetylgalactosaminyltransferase 6-like n=1 Tax=Contarinia nasturtii TaxID=265458 RepID=UPI0012D404DD|nr:N-acetylgalactosaminyltransferase 6-like [Contarinia nasturtii]
MRRNLTSLFKFMLLYALMVFLTIFLYKTFFSSHHLMHSLASARRSIHPRQGSFYMNSVKNELKKFKQLKIDWHDYKLIEAEKLRHGIGEHGIAAFLSPDLEDERKQLFDQNGFNALLSDKIALNRSVKDIRHKDCAKLKYLKDLPTVSIIVPFFNEHWSTLLRTVYSVLNRSPPELIMEIILVDDASNKQFLKRKLDQYVAKYLPKVKIIRLNERSGLIVARLAGAKAANGDVLIFLDSHTEANTNWLPPLLEPIAENYKVCVCPFIDIISYDTFEYRAQDEGARGAFDWQFFYKRLPLLPEDLAHPTRPFKSPIMAGGLFAISARFFWELGGYDDGLDIWGGEQYELSFKIWQCGGEMYDAPCSRVGHIYRGGGVPQPTGRRGDFLHKNYKRVAEVWMDEYKEYLYQRNPEKYLSIDAGNLTEQKAIREKLQCKSFKWFMEEIAFDLPKKYPLVEPPDFASGVIQSESHPNLCVDSLNHGIGQEFGLYTCAENHKRPQLNQFFVLSWHKDIRVHGTTKCWDVSTSYTNAPIIFYNCHGKKGNQLWKYNIEKKWVQHNDRCLDFDAKTMKIFVNQCDANNPNMTWNFGFVNATALHQFDQINT